MEVVLKHDAAITLSYQQLQKLKVLAMDNSELGAFLQKEQLDNPLLEVDLSEAGPVPEKESLPDTGYEETADWFRDGWEAEDASTDGFRASGEDLPQREAVVKKKLSLREFLQEQVEFGNLTGPETKLLLQLLNYLDDHTGYFLEPPQVLRQRTGASEQKLQRALQLIQAMEPAGVGAFSLEESLLLQVARKYPQDKGRILTAMIHSHLELVAQHDFKALQQILGLPVSKLKQYTALLEQLNPCPAQDFIQEETEYVYPDIQADFTRDGWEVSLVRSAYNKLSINSLYLRLAQQAQDQASKLYFTEKIKHAKLIIQAVAQREATIIRTVLCILRHQSAYARGLGPKLPLTMKDVAEELNLHPSTVTRAVRNKYLQLPRGIVLGKDLFQAAQTGKPASGGDNQAYFMALIKQLIAGENPEKPYTDAALTEVLRRQGINLARRTVSEYRISAGIDNAYQRKGQHE